MSRLALSYKFFVLFLALILSTCVPTGEVVKVTIVQDVESIGLDEEDLAKLEEFKKAGAIEKLDENLSNVLEETSHYSVIEYLEKHREKGDGSENDYEVAGYDVLNIIVYEEKDLSREAVRVSADGYISFPLIGRVKVDNLTTAEIEKLIAERLAEEEYLLDAHVSVLVTEYNSKRFLVLGAVEAPGSFPLQAQERVLDAISKAEGIITAGTRGQAGKRAMVIRTEKPGTNHERKIVINIDLHGLLEGRDQISNLLLADEDTLYVPPAEYFYIIGEVRKPGSFVVPDREITLVEAIGMAGGFTKIAARNRTRIIRVENGVEKIIDVKVDAITKAGKKIQDVVIQPNDVVVVPESFF